MYVVTTGDKVSEGDYEGVVPDEDGAKHVSDPKDLTNVVPAVVDKIRKDFKKRKYE